MTWDCLLSAIDRKCSGPPKTHVVGGRARHLVNGMAQRLMPRPQRTERSTKPRPLDKPWSIGSLEADDIDADNEAPTEFKRRSIQKLSLQSALSVTICSGDEDPSPELPPAFDEARNKPIRQDSQRSGVWSWDAIVPSHTCSGSLAAKGAASFDVW